MTTVTTWTGRDANALRTALRMSVTDFAEYLGVARRTVAKWSSRGPRHSLAYGDAGGHTRSQVADFAAAVGIRL